MRNGIIHYSPAFTEILENAMLYVQQVRFISHSVHRLTLDSTVTLFRLYPVRTQTLFPFLLRESQAAARRRYVVSRGDTPILRWSLMLSRW